MVANNTDGKPGKEKSPNPVLVTYDRDVVVESAMRVAAAHQRRSASLSPTPGSARPSKPARQHRDFLNFNFLEVPCRHQRKGAVRAKRSVSLNRPRSDDGRSSNEYAETFFANGGALFVPDRPSGQQSQDALKEQQSQDGLKGKQSQDTPKGQHSQNESKVQQSQNGSEEQQSQNGLNGQKSQSNSSQSLYSERWVNWVSVMPSKVNRKLQEENTLRMKGDEACETKNSDGHTMKENDAHKTKENDAHKTKESDAHKTKENDAHKTKENDAHKRKKNNNHETKGDDAHETKENNDDETKEADSCEGTKEANGRVILKKRREQMKKDKEDERKKKQKEKERIKEAERLKKALGETSEDDESETSDTGGEELPPVSRPARSDKLMSMRLRGLAFDCDEPEFPAYVQWRAPAFPAGVRGSVITRRSQTAGGGSAMCDVCQVCRCVACQRHCKFPRARVCSRDVRNGGVVDAAAVCLPCVNKSARCVEYRADDASDESVTDDRSECCVGRGPAVADRADADADAAAEPQTARGAGPPDGGREALGSGWQLLLRVFCPCLAARRGPSARVAKCADMCTGNSTVAGCRCVDWDRLRALNRLICGRQRGAHDQQRPRNVTITINRVAVADEMLSSNAAAAAAAADQSTSSAVAARADDAGNAARPVTKTITFAEPDDNARNARNAGTAVTASYHNGALVLTTSASTRRVKSKLRPYCNPKQ